MTLNIIRMLVITSLFIGSTSMAEVKKKKQPTLKNDGVSITYIDENDEKKSTLIKRLHNPKCKKVNGGDPEMIWGGSYANKTIPDECKKTFLTTMGKISPIKIAPGIETYAELEVIEYMKKAQTNRDLLLVDARMTAWFEKITIPTAINLPFKSFNPKSQDFEIVMDVAGVEYEDGVYDFSKAKTMLLFCNGAWCPQSTWAIENLVKIGYPKSKLLWYRGGMYSWTALNLTTTKPE